MTLVEQAKTAFKMQWDERLHTRIGREEKTPYERIRDNIIETVTRHEQLKMEKRLSVAARPSVSQATPSSPAIAPSSVQIGVLKKSS